MSCTNCGSISKPCGCKDTPYTTPVVSTCVPACEPKCAEYISARCVLMPDGISEIGSEPNDSVEEIIQRLILFITNPECLDTEAECNCGGGGTPLLLQTNDVDNLTQTILNNKQSYGMLITDQGDGTVLYEAVVNDNKALFVDLAYGDDLTAEKYNIVRPYATFAAAYADAVAGDVVVFNAGTYTLGAVSVTKTDVNFYCKSGVIFNNTGFTLSSGINWEFYGNAVFTGSGQVPLNINGAGGTYNVLFEFDQIDGAMNQAIYIKDITATALNVNVKGNRIRSTSTGNTHLVRVDNSNNANIVINIAHSISGTQRFIVRFGGFSATTPMIGSIVLNCPVIENTGSVAERACIYLDSVLSTQANDGYKIVVNSSIIRQTNATMTEVSPNIISSCVWIDGGNNIYIKGDLEGNSCLAVCNRGGGATYHTGTIVFEGNMSSNIECISSCVKVNNGNGWHSLVVKNGAISSEGNGASLSVVDRPSTWNLVNAGFAGQMYFINCRIINENGAGSALSTGLVSSPNVTAGPDPNPNKLFLFDSQIVSKGSTVCITSSNITEPVSMINTRANVALDTMITDPYSGFTLTASLEIPKY